MAKVVIVGAGPAGATLALLLAERGIDTTLLERQRDFARAFRGEVLMPAGVDALQQMGLGTLLKTIPTREVDAVALYVNRRQVLRAALAPGLAARPPLAVSQPAFVEGVVRMARRHRNFAFHPGVPVGLLIRDGGHVSGIRFRASSRGVAGERALGADLVIGADGRNSTIRRQLGLPVQSKGPLMDIVWFKLPCPPDWTGVRFYAGRGLFLVAYRTWDDSLQVAWAILKGTFGALQNRGMGAWIDDMASHVSDDLASHLRDHRANVGRPFLLQSVADHVTPWSDRGALVVGDAAHAMSPVGAQGINLALRDAIVAANHLVPALSGTVDRTRLATALARIEAERRPEIERILRLQAVPPRLVLSRAWYGELARRVVAQTARRAFVQRAIRGNASVFLNGVTRVSLNV